jgi:uncharacterized protein
MVLPLEHAMFRRAAVSVRDGVRLVFSKQTGAVNLFECGYAQDGVVAAYKRCVNDSTDWVIGPLGRSEVTALSSAKLELRKPTLMLSPLGSMPIAPFAVLSPDLEAEAEAIARQAVDDACRKPMLIEAGGAIASRVSVAIMTYWRAFVNTPLAQYEMNVRDRWQRATESWRRDGVDCVLFAGGGMALAELRPYLRGISVYITSASYETELERTVDWTGVRIADAPWILDHEREEFMALAPLSAQPNVSASGVDNTSPTLARLFALGVDAARLVTLAGRFELPDRFDGAIGQLQLRDGQYQRTPMIGEFRSRIPTRLGR